ncbi:hypothetical protein ACWC0C_13995 [Streptomyces sp. NPDC001709]
MPPGIATRRLDALADTEADLVSLRVLQTAGARLDPALAARVEPGFGCRLQRVAEGRVEDRSS